MNFDHTSQSSSLSGPHEVNQTFQSHLDSIPTRTTWQARDYEHLSSSEAADISSVGLYMKLSFQKITTSSSDKTPEQRQEVLKQKFITKKETSQGKMENVDSEIQRIHSATRETRGILIKIIVQERILGKDTSKLEEQLFNKIAENKLLIQDLEILSSKHSRSAYRNAYLAFSSLTEKFDKDKMANMREKATMPNKEIKKIKQNERVKLIDDDVKNIKNEINEKFNKIQSSIEQERIQANLHNPKV